MPAEVADARARALALLEARTRGTTICPSEVARAIDADDWRAAMPTVHAAIDALVANGLVALSWKGNALPQRDGPYRIARKPR